MASMLCPNPLSFFPPKKFKPLKPLFALSAQGPNGDEHTSDPVKLDVAKAEAYKKSKVSTPVPVTAGDPKGSGESAPEVKDPVKLGMERTREYKKNKGAKPETAVKLKNSGSEDMSVTNTKEVILTNKENKKEEPRLSSINFLGLESEKMSYRGMPPGLAPVMELLLNGEVQKVEIIVGDASKFDVSAPQRKSLTVDADNMSFYKPKVSTWGVFPRPSNISKMA